MNVYFAMLIMILFSGLIIMQKNIMFHSGLEQDLKDVVTKQFTSEGQTYDSLYNTDQIWKWIEAIMDDQYNYDEPPDSSWTIKSLNKTMDLNAPMSFKHVQSCNIITAIYIGRSKYRRAQGTGLRGALRSNVWIEEGSSIPHTQYSLYMPEFDSPENDTELETMINGAMSQTYSQFFLLNGLPKNKMTNILSQLKARGWVNDETTSNVFFKINAYNPNIKRLAQVILIWSRSETGNFASYSLTSSAPDDGFYPDMQSLELEDQLRWFFEGTCILYIAGWFIYKIINIIRRKASIIATLTGLELICIICMIWHFVVWLLILKADNDYRIKIASTYENLDIPADQELSAKAIIKSLYEECNSDVVCPGQVLGILNGTAPYRYTYIRSAIVTLLLLCMLVFVKIPKHSRFALLPNVLRKSAPEIGVIGLLLMLLFFVYAIIGSLLFGHSMTRFSTVYDSFQTNIEVAMGADMDIPDLASSFIDIPAVREGTSYIPVSILPLMYKWSIVILMTFVLINIFVAVVTNAYDVVKRDMEAHRDFDERSVTEKFMSLLSNLNIRARWKKRRDGRPDNWYMDENYLQDIDLVSESYRSDDVEENNVRHHEVM